MAELLILLGLMQVSPGLAIVAALGAILGAAYFLRFYQRAFLGPVTQAPVATLSDLRTRELLVAGAMGLSVLAGGLFPNWVQGVTANAARNWAERMEAAAATDLNAGLITASGIQDRASLQPAQ